MREVEIDGATPVYEHVLLLYQLQIIKLVTGTEDTETFIQSTMGLEQRKYHVMAENMGLYRLDGSHLFHLVNQVLI